MRAVPLTARGASLLGVGAALCAAAWFGREAALLWPGIFLVLLPALSCLGVLAGDPRLVAQHRPRPEEGTAHSPLEVEVVLRQRRPGLAAEVAAEDALPAALGGPRAFALPLPGAGRTARFTLALTPTRRGRHTLDTLRYRYSDPLGLARRTVTAFGADEVVVLPRVLDLRAVSPAASGRTGETPVPHLALSGPDDVLVREYRPRDDVRRIHWPSTARTGTLMVRREEQAWDPFAWVLLDARPAVFRRVPEGEESFEWLVTLAASVGETLLRAGYTVGLAGTDGGTYVARGRDARSAGWLHRLVDAAPRGAASLLPAVRAATPGSEDHVVVALLGRLTPADARELTALRDGNRSCWALYVPGEGAGAAAAESAGAALLAQHGWVVGALPVGADAAAAWAAASGGGGRLS